MVKNCFALFTLVVLTGPGAFGGDGEPKVEWKFDKPFTQKWSTQVKQTLTYKGKEGEKPTIWEKQSQKVDITVLWTPVAADAKKTGTQEGDKKDADKKDADKKKDDAKAKDDKKDDAKPKDDKKAHAKKAQALKLKITSLALEAEVGKEKLAFDSAKKAEDNNPLDALLRKLVQAELTFQLELPTMKVMEISGLDEITKGVPEDQRAVLQRFLSKETLTRLAQAAFPQLPGKMGEQLKREEILKVPSVGTYKTETVVIYKAAKDKMVDFDVRTSWDFQPAGEASGPFQVKAMTPAKGTGDGTVVFDPAAGRIQKSRLEIKDWKRVLELLIGSEKVEGELTQQYLVTVESSDAPG
jgi:hypothetical protein